MYSYKLNNFISNIFMIYYFIIMQNWAAQAEFPSISPAGTINL
jgi:hypothetical protein